LLALPVTEVRRRLRLDAPPVYTEIRSDEIKAAAAAQKRSGLRFSGSGRADSLSPS
jgi:hypothetical protein